MDYLLAKGVGEIAIAPALTPEPGWRDEMVAELDRQFARVYRASLEKHSPYGRCAECRFLASCAICPLAIAHQPGNDDPRRMPDFACAFMRTALGFRARFPRQPTVADLARGRVKPPAAIRRLLAAHTAPHT